MSSTIKPGFICFHGNRLEDLKDAVLGVLRNNPLEPLEDESFLVQSNGLADWLKIALATDLKVCASTRVMLPARFVWEMYRAVLGPDDVPTLSPLDRRPMVWRLMRLLPNIVARPEFASLKRYMTAGGLNRRYQLAERLADLIDLYQVYRLDWLRDWEDGNNRLIHPEHAPRDLAEGELWQAELWRALLASIPETERYGGRPQVHSRFMAALNDPTRSVQRLPRRVVVFGVSSLSQQTLEALGALSSRVQVILAVANPCRHYWADIMSGREFFKSQRRRQDPRNGKSLDNVDFQQMHRHSHPLLASWGQLGRDYIRMLDQYDDHESTRKRFPMYKLDLFDAGEGAHLLARVQDAVLNLLPLEEHDKDGVDPYDGSIQFHVVHSVQREVEVLHDRLLAMLDEDQGKLRPRDIVVMVPDIDKFAPSIHAVFGQFAGTLDKRHIPYDISDMAERRVNPVLVAMEWLMRLPEHRCLQSELRDLLDVPAIASRFGIADDGLAQVGKWIERSGVRWGLDEAHRGDLGLAPAGMQNSWLFGLNRMMLGYANGLNSAFRGIEPFGEVGGLDAGLIGSMSMFIEKMLNWRTELAKDATPHEWIRRAHRLMADFFDLSSDRDRMTRSRLEMSLRNWREHCAVAGFDDEVNYQVACESWLGAIDEAALSQRFVSGGVTFCTLMPMRAIPFEVVCLLGMNDGDFPRRVPRPDFDLLALPGQYRPGDRSRKNDDRYLMLEALLSARQKLYVSWVGRNVRDNCELPPSILVSQLRDYLANGWSAKLDRLTTVHPMQPFSRKYFEAGSGLETYAREWYPAHVAAAARPDCQNTWQPAANVLKLSDFSHFLRYPVRHFFKHRMQVEFGEHSVSAINLEPFSFNHLEKFKISSFLLEDGDAIQEEIEHIPIVMQEKALRLAREGRLPMKAFGEDVRRDLIETLTPARSEWIKLCKNFPIKGEAIELDFCHKGVRVHDVIDGVRSNGNETVLAYLDCRDLLEEKDAKPIAYKMILAWLRQVACAVAGQPHEAHVICCNGTLVLQPIKFDDATAILQHIIDCWLDGMEKPMPVACKTGIAIVAEKAHRAIYDGSGKFSGEADLDACLARMWPDCDSLEEAPGWKECAQRMYGHLHTWHKEETKYKTMAFGTRLEEAV